MCVSIKNNSQIHLFLFFVSAFFMNFPTIIATHLVRARIYPNTPFGCNRLPELLQQYSLICIIRQIGLTSIQFIVNEKNCSLYI